MIKTLYTTRATSTGGREGTARSEDGAFEVKLALPKEMGGAVSHLLNKHSKNQLDKNYPDYKKRAKFMKFRAPEELYDIVKDPGCRNNLAKNPEFRPVLEKIRKNMIQLLKETQDHELENYVNSL